MAFDGPPSTSAYSLFPSFQHQVSVNGGVGRNGSMSSPIVSHPSVSILEQDTSSKHRSHIANDDPFGLITSAQSNIKSRKPTDNTDCDGETGLRRLVSNILDDADSQDSYFSDRSRPCIPLWPALTEELPEYSQLEMKTQQNHIFPPNYAFPEAFSKTRGQSVNKDVEEFFQQANGNTTNQQWLFNLPNGDRDSYTQNTHQKMPSGRPNSISAYLSQKQQGKSDYTLPYKDGRNGQPMNHFPDLSDVLRSDSEMRSLCFNPSYEDHFSQSSAKPISNEQCTSQEVNQLVNSLQSFMAGENDSLCQVDFPSMHRQSVAMHYDETMAEQCKIIASAMSSQRGRKFGAELMEQNGGENNQIVNYHAFQDQPGFSPQNANYFEQPKPIFASLNGSNQYQSKVTMHRKNAPIPSMNMDQFSKQHIQQAKVQSKIRPPMQEEKRRMLLSGFPGEGVQARPLTDTDMPGGDEKWGLLQNMYFDPIENMQLKRIEEENTIRAANAQQLLPCVCPVNDSGRISSVTMNHSNLSSRATLPYGRTAPGMDIGDVMSANESAALNFYVRGMRTHRVDGTYHGNASAMTTSVVMNRGGGPVLQLNVYLEECYEQWSCLEMEREKTQAVLSLTFPGKKSAPVNNTNMPRTPPNPTRVDHLIFKNQREQARVAGLLDRMVRLCNIPLHANIHSALTRHNTAICITQARRKEEIANLPKHQCQRAHFTEDRDTLLMAIALKDLAVTTRKLRNALWCAHQMILPKPVRVQEQHAVREASHTRGSPSPFEVYSF
ncbi:uncharacterized protein moto [Notolabrus celidotus]|uniref:uncharacterized protein moto n=1 Tax=Notolabrus celidotus TaxID=1203425 RepID=UPI00148F7622|nr:uncharacterized protein moto [Notolabrus celidotus]